VDPLLSAGVVLLNHGAAQPRSCSTTVLLNHRAKGRPAATVVRERAAV